MLCTLIAHRNDVKKLWSKHCSETTRPCGLWFHLSFEHFDVIFKSTDHGKL